MIRLTNSLRTAGVGIVYLSAVGIGVALTWGPDPIIVGGAVALAAVVGGAVAWTWRGPR